MILCFMDEKSQRNISITAASKESLETATLESIKYWQEQGATKIWNAMFEMLDFWFISRGLDPAVQRIDRSVVGIKKVPWSK